MRISNLVGVSSPAFNITIINQSLAELENACLLGHALQDEIEK